MTIGFALVIIFYNALLENIPQKFRSPQLLTGCWCAAIAVRWLMLENRQEIIDYLISCGPFEERVMQYYDLYTVMFITAVVCLSAMFILSEVIFKGRFSTAADKLTCMVIIAVTVASMVLSLNHIVKFYDSGYITGPPALRGALIIEISFVIRKILNIKREKMSAL